ncbi:Na/Pi cotransporter family protein [Sulfurospirillum sp. 1612]|uniref:Na/Pi cotransporter family protein n=1 Tax=Sulfurospirillum sp. 1612 TaxID=3094835 RepID=UPI002F93C98A
MHYTSILLQAFSGLGLFLFGMYFLEAQIKESAGTSFRKMMKKATKTNMSSLFIGISATTIFQSSSLVSLMVLSLIGAEMMSLQSAVSVIIGANLGTTATAWIMAIVGFKANITLILYIMIGLGGLGKVLISNENKWKNYSGVLFGIGLIFLGLNEMKDSLGIFAKHFDVASITLENPYWYAVIGLVLTALIQSSSASIAIIQSALFANLITFHAAGAFVIGADIGTTITIILGSLGGISNKKRTAAAHVIYNITTDLMALCLLFPLIAVVNYLLPTAESVIKIALFHSLYNVIGVLIWFPLIAKFSKLLQKFFKTTPHTVTQYIHQTPAHDTQTAIDALQKEIEYLSDKIERFALYAINIPNHKILESHDTMDTAILSSYQDNIHLSYHKIYEQIRLLEGEIYRYISTISIQNQDKDSQEILEHLSRKIALLTAASKSIKDMLLDLAQLYNAPSMDEQNFYENLRSQILKSTHAFHQARSGDNSAIEEIQKMYEATSDSYKKNIDLVEKIAKNFNIKSEMTAIVVNDLYLAKNYSKSLLKSLIS